MQFTKIEVIRSRVFQNHVLNLPIHSTKTLKTYRKWKAVGHFQNAANIKSKQLPCHKRRHALLAVLDDLQGDLYTKNN